MNSTQSPLGFADPLQNFSDYVDKRKYAKVLFSTIPVPCDAILCNLDNFSRSKTLAQFLYVPDIGKLIPRQKNWKKRLAKIGLDEKDIRIAKRITKDFATSRINKGDERAKKKLTKLYEQFKLKGRIKFRLANKLSCIKIIFLVGLEDLDGVIEVHCLFIIESTELLIIKKSYPRKGSFDIAFRTNLPFLQEQMRRSLINYWSRQLNYDLF